MRNIICHWCGAKLNPKRVSWQHGQPYGPTCVKTMLAARSAELKAFRDIVEKAAAHLATRVQPMKEKSE